ncbi:urate hydroxylase PuuD [Marinobacterium sp. D7]|uniref:urate hydroxylase PuuD n=1 Tax=Marinobacterium ramblicola TaxID=2849041 RepID=UPI001C2D762F|nr:urate hydroxylase PuuD [Marinobacterium ramblicola]MBV1788112.1 urate hydroxylase PuuD [Marinobacterium ramblicola]
MPKHLHWFKWEAYSTWITGALLLTLPVLFIMLSNHYPITYGHQYGWLILKR